MQCTKCGELFWDKDVVEPALHGFDNTYEDVQKTKRIFSFLFVAPMCILAFVGLAWMIIDNRQWAASVFLAIPGYMIWSLFSYVRENYFDKEAIRNKTIEQKKNMMLRLNVCKI